MPCLLWLEAAQAALKIEAASQRGHHVLAIAAKPCSDWCVWGSQPCPQGGGDEGSLASCRPVGSGDSV